MPLRPSPGALGYVNNDQATDKIVEGIRRVLEGKVYLSDAMVETMLQRTVGDARKESMRSPLDALANRELEVFRLIGQGVKTAATPERQDHRDLIVSASGRNWT
jgi:DNA-binding NarL/FixJ family response regulator